MSDPEHRVFVSRDGQTWQEVGGVEDVSWTAATQTEHSTLLITGVPLGAQHHFLCDHWHALFCVQSQTGTVLIVRGPNGSPCDPRRRWFPPPCGITETYTEAELLHEISMLVSEGMVTGS